MFTIPWVTCHVSCVMCHVSCVMCDMWCVKKKNGGASRWIQIIYLVRKVGMGSKVESPTHGQQAVFLGRINSRIRPIAVEQSAGQVSSHFWLRVFWGLFITAWSPSDDWWVGWIKYGFGIKNGLIEVKEEGWTEFSEGWHGCSEGFPEGEARGKSQGAALPVSCNWIYHMLV